MSRRRDDAAPSGRLRRALRRAAPLRASEAQRLLAARVEHDRLVDAPAEPLLRSARLPMAQATDRLDAHGVIYVVVPAGVDAPHRVVLAQEDAGRARRALRPLSPAAGQAPGTDDEQAPGGDDRPGPATAAGPAAGTGDCVVEAVALDRDLPERLWRVAWDGPGEPAHRGVPAVAMRGIGPRSQPVVCGPTAAPRVDEVTFPIDVVYTWVDGDDPDWQARKAAALRAAGRPPGQADAPEGAAPTEGAAPPTDAALPAGAAPPTGRAARPVDADDRARYRSRDELRYSLRSLAAFAPFVRHVFVVTDGQAPAWLDTAHPRLTVVDHREILPAHALPTFNSHAIESRLHHIPGLAEHYLYLNDDFFLGRPVTPEHFFDAGGAARFFPSPARIAPDGLVDPVRPDGPAGGEPAAGTDAAQPTAGAPRSVDAAAHNTRRLLSERFGRVVEHKIKHAPYAQRRSVLFELEEVFGDELARTAANRLRSHDDVAVPSSLSHYYGLLTGRAVPGRIASKYVGLDDPALRRRLRELQGPGGFDVLCVNDAGGEHPGRERALARFMAARWPTRSPFER